MRIEARLFFFFAFGFFGRLVGEREREETSLLLANITG
jgi:hypothetical protein